MKIFLILIIILLAGLGIYYFYFKDVPAEGISNFEECVFMGYPVMESYPRQCKVGNRTFVEEPEVMYKDLIRIKNPRQNEVISNPVVVNGEARGNWYFEASFPVEVVDEDGTSLGIAPVQAGGEWMTADFVPFSGSISYKQPKGKSGSIIFRKDNPSGLSEFDDSVSIAVKFR